MSILFVLNQNGLCVLFFFFCRIFIYLFIQYNFTSQLQRPAVLGGDVDYTEVPPAFPSGGSLMSALPTGDWSGHLSVNQLHAVHVCVCGGKPSQTVTVGSLTHQLSVRPARHKEQLDTRPVWRERCSPRMKGPAPRRCADSSGVHTAPWSPSRANAPRGSRALIGPLLWSCLCLATGIPSLSIPSSLILSSSSISSACTTSTKAASLSAAASSITRCLSNSTTVSHVRPGPAAGSRHPPQRPRHPSAPSGAPAAVRSPGSPRTAPTESAQVGVKLVRSELC